MGRLEDARRRRAPISPPGPTLENLLERAAQARLEDIASLDSLIRRVRMAIMRQRSAKQYRGLHARCHRDQWSDTTRKVPPDRYDTILTSHPLGPGTRLLLGVDPVAIMEGGLAGGGVLQIHFERPLWEIGGWNHGRGDWRLDPPQWEITLSNRRRRAAEYEKEVQGYLSRPTLDQFSASLIDHAEQTVTVILDALGIPYSEVED